MAVQEKAVGSQFQARIRPISAGDGKEFGQIGMDGRLAAEQPDRVRTQSPMPGLHPGSRVRRRQHAFMPLVGIMRAALTGEVATVRDMQLKAGDIQGF